MRRSIMACHWKMYKTPRETCAFFQRFNPLVASSTHCEIVICPPFIDLTAAIEATRGTRTEIGGQNLFWATEGAYTGEVSGEMLKTLGCKWGLVAHSERRQYFGETNAGAQKKILAALDAGLTPIYCVGETPDERESGKTHQGLETQFQGGVAARAEEQFLKIALAYEPVSAIGTGKVATPEIDAE